MMRLLALGLLLTANVAMASAPDVPSPNASSPAEPIPWSIWRTGADGGVEHLQSGLNCPARLGNYLRNRLDIYNRFGLDVSCNYRAGADDITVYLTWPDGSSLDAAYAEAKRELLEYAVKKQPVRMSEAMPQMGGLAWKTALYSEEGGALHSGIWMAELSGWILEFRATYPAASETAVLADISSLTDIVRKSAGVRLGLCAGAPSPKRPGTAVTDKALLSQYAMMSSITGGAIGQMAKSADAKAELQPIVWCAEKPVVQGNFAVLFWRGVEADGADAMIDRITIMSVQESPTLEVAPDALTSLVEAGGKKALWAASIKQGGKTLIFGYFDGRPTPESVSVLFGDVLAGRAKPLVAYGGEGNKLTIELPSKN